jgi:hypothetical protein
MQRPDRDANQAAWTGFLIVSFAALGLVGAFGTFAAQVPFDRAVARSITLDKVLAAAHATDPRKAEEALRPLLGDSADPVLNGPGTLESRVETERVRMLNDLHAEARIYGFRFRCYLAVFTVMASVFGAMVMSFGRHHDSTAQSRACERDP